MSTPVRVTPSPVDGVIEEIRVAMARRRWSQRDLAKAVGEAEHWVHRRLTGKVDISLGELYRIADALGVSARSLLPVRSPTTWPLGHRGHRRPMRLSAPLDAAA